MLYLTNYTSDLGPLYRAAVFSRMILVDLFDITSELDYSACIVDIDHATACVLALKGHQLFRVLRVEPYGRSAYYGYAIVDDVETVWAWRLTF